MTGQDLIRLFLEISVFAMMGLFAFSLLFGSREKTGAGYILAGMTAIIALLMMMNSLSALEEFKEIQESVNLFLELLLPPLVFLYVSEVRENAKPLGITDLLHALPALAGLGLWQSKVIGNMDGYVLTVWGVYVLAGFWTLFKHLENYKPDLVKRFLIFFLGGMVLILGFRFLVAYDAQFVNAFRGSVYYIILLSGVLAGGIAIFFMALKSPHFLTAPEFLLKYRRSEITDRELKTLKARLKETVENKKLYVEPNLKITEVAGEMNITVHQLSQLINRAFDMNFSAYINYLRVMEAARQLREAKTTGKHITTIIYDVGFGSKSAFNREFKKHFDISPKELKNQRGD